MFQYISCYSLSMWIRPCDNRPWVSIHLMLLFIEGTKDTIDNSGKFQYISCYSLSWNTNEDFRNTITFQYISCYSLSSHFWILSNWLYQFQYISCYSLSPFIYFPFCKYFSFQYISCYSLSEKSLMLEQPFLVSIHLMLLFIPLLYSISHT